MGPPSASGSKSITYSDALNALDRDQRIFDPLVSFSQNAHPDSSLRYRHVPDSLGRDRLDGIDEAALVERVPETKLDAATCIRSPVVVRSFRKRESRPYVQGQRGVAMPVDVDHRFRRILDDFDYAAEFNPIYGDLAAQYAVALYPFFLDGVAADPSLNLEDGMHPNAEGIGVMVERMKPLVKSLLKAVFQFNIL